MIAVLAVSVCGFFAMRNDILATEARNKELEEQIKQQKISNNELSSVLDEENADDFYTNIAEDDLGYGTGKEKVYVDITGQ